MSADGRKTCLAPRRFAAKTSIKRYGFIVWFVIVSFVSRRKGAAARQRIAFALFDGVMWTVSDKTVWLPLYIFLAVAVCRRHSCRDAVICLLAVVAAIAATDQTCGSLLRPLFGRLRPSNPDNPVAAFVHIVNNYRGGNYGFPSCHAANSFCLAVYLSLCFRGKRAAVLLFTWAALVSYSRVYLGVHYPGDVIGGMFVGSVYAVVFFYIYVVAVSESKPAVQAARLMFYNVSRRFGHLQVFAEVLICYVRKSFRVKRLR